MVTTASTPAEATFTGKVTTSSAVLATQPGKQKGGEREEDEEAHGRLLSISR